MDDHPYIVQELALAEITNEFFLANNTPQVKAAIKASPILTSLSSDKLSSIARSGKKKTVRRVQKELEKKTR